MEENSWLTPNAYGYDSVINFNKNKKNEINYNGTKNPNFYNIIINSEIMMQKSKDQFLEKFWIKFSNSKNKNFRKSVFGKYLFWLNDEYIGVIDCLSDLDSYGNVCDKKFIIFIGEENEKEFFTVPKNDDL